MAVLKWDDSYSVKVTMLDDHHKTLFSIVNRFYDVSQKTDDKNELCEVFKRVLDYTQMHFKIEEHYMQKYGYPDFEGHKKRHEDLLKKAASLYEGIEAGTKGIKELAVAFLKEWLEGHIKGTDTKYSSHLNKNGMS